MSAVRDTTAVVGALLILATAWSVVVTVVVPRRVPSRIVRIVGLAVRRGIGLIADRFRQYERRDRILAFQAPLGLMGQIIGWLALFEVGFGLLLWPVVGSAGLAGAFTQAGSSLSTLGIVAPHSGGNIAIDILAGFAGLGTVALQIAYLPTLYGAFNRRETLVTMLDTRAGVPSWGPELLARTHYGLGTGESAVSKLPELFEQWESWSADVSESHSTYITLIFFRSPRPLSSWVTSQLAVLDAAALYLALLPDAPGAISARLCLRGGFSCLTTLARHIGADVPVDADPADGISLTSEEFAEAVERLRVVDFPLERPTEDAWLDFLGWRVNYEQAAYALARAVDAPPAKWSGPRRRALEVIAPIRPPTRRPSSPPSSTAHRR
ncbi:MAG TPA: hypothetical protein VK386_05070 [Acidimicrobiales bacterium]|nr:hypothetical protein [Acidimicrobiales bacterium]